MNLKIKITLENKRLLKLRGIIKTKIWCAECGTETHFVPETELSEVLEKINADEKLHKAVSADGKNLICLESLTKNQN